TPGAGSPAPRSRPRGRRPVAGCAGVWPRGRRSRRLASYGLRVPVEHADPAGRIARAGLLGALAEPLPAPVLELDDGRSAPRPEAHLDLCRRLPGGVSRMPCERDAIRRL